MTKHILGNTLNKCRSFPIAVTVNNMQKNKSFHCASRGMTFPVYIQPSRLQWLTPPALPPCRRFLRALVECLFLRVYVVACCGVCVSANNTSQKQWTNQLDLGWEAPLWIREEFLRFQEHLIQWMKMGVRNVWLNNDKRLGKYSKVSVTSKGERHLDTIRHYLEVVYEESNCTTR